MKEKQIRVSKGVSPSNQNVEVLFITFDYDAGVVGLIKQLPGRKWHQSFKAWEVPQSAIYEIKRIFDGYDLVIAENVDQAYEVLKGDFENEIALIADLDMQDFVIGILEEVPEYFWEVAASSSGKYHPAYALGDGGLIRHTKVAVNIAYDFFRNETICEMFSIYDQETKDSIIVALLLHDCLKHGKEKKPHTVATHPQEAAEFIIEYNNECGTLTDEQAVFISNMILSHMGQWNTNRQGEVILPIPESHCESFVHMCDYLASRKFLEAKFDENWNFIG